MTKITEWISRNKNLGSLDSYTRLFDVFSNLADIQTLKSTARALSTGLSLCDI